MTFDSNNQYAPDDAKQFQMEDKRENNKPKAQHLGVCLNTAPSVENLRIRTQKLEIFEFKFSLHQSLSYMFIEASFK